MGINWSLWGPVGVSNIVKQIDGTVGCVRIGDGL